MNIVLKNAFYFTYEFLCNLNPKKRIHKTEDGGEEFFFFFKGRVYLEKNEKMSCH